MYLNKIYEGKLNNVKTFIDKTKNFFFDFFEYKVIIYDKTVITDKFK